MITRSSQTLALAALFAILGAAPAAAADAPAAPTKPLRTLVYAVTLNTRMITTNKEAGFGSMGDAESRNVRNIDDDGRLNLDVMYATQDDGLVVDVSYTGALTVQPPIRVAVTADGRLLYDPKRALSVPARRLLPLLARGIIAGHDASVGQSWSAADDPDAPQFTVRSVSAPDATLAVKQTSVPIVGAKEHLEGATVYDTSKSRPDDYRYTAIVDRPNGGTQELETTETLHAKLTSDTFDKK